MPITQTTAQANDIAMFQRGIELEGLYQGFFGSPEICSIPAEMIPPEFFERKEVTVVDAGSSQGALGHFVREKFEAAGVSVRLVLIDTNATALEQTPVQGEKIVADLLDDLLPEGTADVIILRSVLQYVEWDEQVPLLSSLHRVLKPGGVLISQHGAFATQGVADAMNGLFGCADRHSRFRGDDGWMSIHREVFDEITVSSKRPELVETFDEFFVDRVAAGEEVKARAKTYIAEHLAQFGEALVQRENPYAWVFPFQVLACRK